MMIDGRKIGDSEPPFVIAEVSANHNGEKARALEIINRAKACGADAVKFQTYTPDTMTVNSDQEDFRVDSGLWAGSTLYELYSMAQTPFEWQKEMFDYARSIDITCFSTPFDETAVDLLEDLNATAYKIASFEGNDLPLIRYVASTKKPLIISTGMLDLPEIEEAVDTALAAGCNGIALLHCVSGYPAPPDQYNLRTLVDLRQRFNLPVGLSDHTLDNSTAVASVALGASLIEKHFTLDRKGGGPDDSFSLEPEGLRELCVSTRTAWSALGTVDYGLKDAERGSVKFRRSLYFVEDLSEGDVISAHSVRRIRPGFGLPPKYIDLIIGKRVSRDVKKFEPVSFEVITEINS